MSTSIPLPTDDLSAETSWLRNLPTSPVEAALVYHAHGWHPVALSPLNGAQCACSKGPLCRRPGKHPWVSTWTEPASRETIEGWFTADPNADVGLLTDHGFWALDVDGNNGITPLASLEARHGAYAPAPAASTSTPGAQMNA